MIFAKRDWILPADPRCYSSSKYQLATMDIYPEYLNTIFVAIPPEEGWPNRFFIITACNPRSSGDRSSDDKAHMSLRKTLSRLDCWKHRVDAASPDWKHREKGFAVGGLDLEKAIELGRQFDQNAIFAIESDGVWTVGCFDGSRQAVGSLSKRLYKPADEPKYRIYVVRLDDSVLKVKRFREANPNHKPGQPCYYVGMTGLSPEQRFSNHKAGNKDCTLVRYYGLHLARKKFESIPLLSLSDAKAMEGEYADYLRSRGYAVWQN